MAMKLLHFSIVFTFLVTCQAVKVTNTNSNSLNNHNNKWKSRDGRSYLGHRSSLTSASYSLNNNNNVNVNGTAEYGVSTLCPESYGSTGKRRLVCYYRVEESFRPYDLDPCLCTHIVYSYVAVKDNFAFIAGKKGDLKFLASLKQRNPSLKVLVSIRPADRTFTFESNATSSSGKSKAIFAKRIKDFVTRHNLDGIDLDWEFFREADRSVNGREPLVTLVRGLKTVLKSSPSLASLSSSGYLVTLTTSKFPRDLTENYDFANLNMYVDFVNLPAFSFDSQGKTVKHPSRLHGISDMENMDSLVDLALALGLPHDHLTVGVPAHGILYKLANTSQTTPGSPAIPWNYNDAIISHTKICSIRDGANWTMVRDKDLTAPYIYSKDKWVGFDDEISIKLKAKYVVLRNLGGVAIWSPNDDDPTGKCGYGSYPLLHTVRSVLTKSAEYINYSNRTLTITSNGNKGSYGPSSYFNVIEKYGKVERVTDEELGETPVPLPCHKQGYMKHPKDCARFYRCVKFDEGDPKSVNKFQYGCPPGLVFDELYEICNWPSWSPACGGSGEILQAPRSKFSCPSYGYFQDPSDCAYFYYCSDFGKGSFQPYEFKCPFDLGFDEEKLLCNWKWLVNGCKEASKPPPDTATEVNLYPDLVNGKLDSASQGLDGEPDELLEKRSDDGNIQFADESTHPTAIKSEGRKSFARSIKDAVTDALDNVKSILGMDQSQKPQQQQAQQQQPDLQKRQDILPDPVFLAEESIIGNLFAGMNPFANHVDKKSNRKAPGDNRPPKLVGKEQFISIPIIEVADERPLRKPHSPIPRHPVKLGDEPQRGPGGKRKQLPQQPTHIHYRPSPVPLPHAPTGRVPVSREPTRGTPVPGHRVKNPTPERRPQRPQTESPELIPVPILTLKEALKPSSGKPKGERRPQVHNNKVRPEPEPHHRIRPEPEPEPRRKPTRGPEGPRDIRPSNAPREHLKPQPERHHHISGHRIPEAEGHRHEKPHPERRPNENRKPQQQQQQQQQQQPQPQHHHQQQQHHHQQQHHQQQPHQYQHQQHIPSHVHHQAQPSIHIDHREPAPRPNSVHPKPKRPAAPVANRQKRPPPPSVPSVPTEQGKRRPYIPQQGSIAAQLPPELFQAYDVDIKPLSVHPIISPPGTNIDFDNLSLLPPPHQSSKPKTKRPFGMPGHKPERPVTNGGNRQHQQHPGQRGPINHPKQQPPQASWPSQQVPPRQAHRPPHAVADSNRGHHQDHLVEKLPVQRLPVVKPVEIHHLDRPHLDNLNLDQVIPVEVRPLHPQSIGISQESLDAHNKRQIEKLHHPKSHQQQHQQQATLHQQQQQQQQVHHQPVVHHQVPQHQAPQVPHQIHSHSHVIQHGPPHAYGQMAVEPLPPLQLSVPGVSPQPPVTLVSTSSPQHPSYSAQYQPQTSGSQIHQQYHVNQVSEKLAPQLNQPEVPSSTVTKNGFKPISPQYISYTSQPNGNYVPVSSYVQGSHYSFSQPLGYSRQSVPVTVAPSSLWTSTIGASVASSSSLPSSSSSSSSSQPLTGKTTKSSLLIIPVPDSHYKANSLNDVIKIAKEYPQLFPPAFDFSKVASVTRTKQEEPSPVYYESPSSSGYQVKNDTHSDFIIMTVNEEDTTRDSVVTTASAANYWTPSTIRPTEKPGDNRITNAPVVIKLEIPESKPDIVKSIVNQVKDTLAKVPSTTASPVQVSVSVSSTVPVTSKSPSTPSPVDSNVSGNLGNNKNIPQSLYESIQQVIAQHLYNQLSDKGKDGHTSTTESIATAGSSLSSSSASSSVSSSSSSSSYSSTTEVPVTSTESIDVTTLNPTTIAEVIASSSQSPHAVLEQIPYNQLYNLSDPHSVGSAWPYQPWFQPPVYANPYAPYPHYAPPPINQTNQYFPYPSYPYGQWASNGNYTNAFAGWYEWAYGQQQATSPSPATTAATTTNATTTSGSGSSKLPSSMLVTITTTVAPPTVSTKEAVYTTTKNPTGESFDILRTKATSATPESPQIQVYIVQGPNGPQVQTKTVNSKDGVKSPNVQVYVIDENSKDTKPYSPAATARPSSSSEGGQYFQYSHSHFQPEESQVKPFTTSSPTSDNLYVKEEAYRDLEYEDEDSSFTGSTETTRPSFSQFLPSSKVQSLQHLYNQQGFPGLRNFTDGSVPESACTRPGLFQHPHDCNKFYECYFDRFVNKFTLHLFECPVKLAFDSRIVGCSGPTDPTVCVQY